MHLSFASRGSTPGTPPGNPRAPRGVGTVLVFLFSREEGELFSFENGDIPTGFVRGSATGKVKSALPATMVDV